MLLMKFTKQILAIMLGSSSLLLSGPVYFYNDSKEALTISGRQPRSGRMELNIRVFPDLPKMDRISIIPPGSEFKVGIPPGSRAVICFQDNSQHNFVSIDILSPDGQLVVYTEYHQNVGTTYDIIPKIRKGYSVEHLVVNGSSFKDSVQIRSADTIAPSDPPGGPSVHNDEEFKEPPKS